RPSSTRFPYTTLFRSIVSPQQILELSDCVLRRVVQHANWHKHGQIVRECAAKNEIESRLLDTEVDVFSIEQPGLDFVFRSALTRSEEHTSEPQSRRDL